MATRMQQRRGTAAQWTAANPVLAAGEIGFETDTNKFKMGNGSSAWTALTYFANAAELAAIIDGAPGVLDTLNELAASLGDDPAFFTTVATNLESHRTSTGVHGVADMTLLQTATQVSTSISTHNSDTTDVHGIANTANLATTGDITTHNSDTTNVHGIADTTGLAYAATVATDISSAIGVHSNDTTNVHGIADTAGLAYAATVATDISGAVSTHASDTTDVHGITNTANLAYAATVATDISSAIGTHNSDTTNVHGIADTSVLATTGDITTHSDDTTNIHGILNTALLVTQDDLTDAIDAAETDFSTMGGTGIDWNAVDTRFDIDSTVATKTYADSAVSTHTSETTDIHGIADTSLLATKSYADTAEADAITAAGTAADSKIATAVAALTKSSVGLGNVDNTSDANKPVSTATQTALDAKASLAGATFTGSVEIDQNLTVDGNLTVNGTTFNASATSITIEDNMVQLAHQNAANTVDLGVVVAYNDGSAKHAGIVRDVSDAKWKLFKGVSTEPSTTVAFGEGSLDDLAVGALEATTVTPSSGVVFTDGTQTKEGVVSRTPIIQKTAAYTLSALTERDSLIEVSSATGVTVSIPTDATLNFPIGTSIDILQTGAGQVTIAAATPGTTTVNATPGLKLRTTWSSATLFKRAANTWVVYGDLTA